MLSMLLSAPRIRHDVVDENNRALVQMRTKDIIHTFSECYQCIRQPNWHQTYNVYNVYGDPSSIHAPHGEVLYLMKTLSDCSSNYFFNSTISTGARRCGARKSDDVLVSNSIVRTSPLADGGPFKASNTSSNSGTTRMSCNSWCPSSLTIKMVTKSPYVPPSNNSS